MTHSVHRVFLWYTRGAAGFAQYSKRKHSEILHGSVINKDILIHMFSYTARGEQTDLSLKPRESNHMFGGVRVMGSALTCSCV